jgi:hypothetical protein
MKTVLYDWTKINPEIKISYTKKKFFNQFYYRLVVSLPGARLVCGAYKNFGKTLEEKVANYNDLYQKNIYRYYQQDVANADRIRNFIPIYQSRTNGIKFSFKSSTVTIYSDSEKHLYNIAAEMTPNSCTDVSIVESTSTKKLLDKGYTIVKTKRSHPYKVMLKCTFAKASEKHMLKDYLANAGDDVKITKHILNRLGSDIKYFQGGYLYVNDIRIVDILRMISPNLIGPVNQVINQ